MTEREAICKILELNDIDPDLQVGHRTAFDILEAAVMGVMDQIEEETENE